MIHPGDVPLLLLREQLNLVDAAWVAQDRLGGSVNTVAKLLTEHADNGRLRIKRSPPIHQGATIKPNIDLRESTVATSDLLEWLDTLAQPKRAPHETPRWPWGSHETELLRKLAEAAEKFWKLYDPADNTTAPTNEQVAEWLVTQGGVSKRNAEVMASILRADGLPTGPRTST
jgi:hypothetical protein